MEEITPENIVVTLQVASKIQSNLSKNSRQLQIDGSTINMLYSCIEKASYKHELVSDLLRDIIKTCQDVVEAIKDAAYQVVSDRHALLQKYEKPAHFDLNDHLNPNQEFKTPKHLKKKWRKKIVVPHFHEHREKERDLHELHVKNQRLRWIKKAQETNCSLENVVEDYFADESLHDYRKLQSESAKSEIETFTGKGSPAAIAQKVHSKHHQPTWKA